MGFDCGPAPGIQKTVDCELKIKVKCPMCPECGNPMNYEEKVIRNEEVPIKIFGFINSTQKQEKIGYRYGCLCCQYKETLNYLWDFHNFQYFIDIEKFKKNKINDEKMIRGENKE